MSAEMQFSDNVRDLSNTHGVDAGFQFEFYCQRCSDRWRTAFKPYRSGQAGGWLQNGAGRFGGLLREAGALLNGMAQAGWHSARDQAFKEALAAGKAYFNRCGSCHDYVCGPCFDGAKGLFFDCAPNVNVAISRARSEGEVASASELANNEGRRRGLGRRAPGNAAGLSAMPHRDAWGEVLSGMRPQDRAAGAVSGVHGHARTGHQVLHGLWPAAGVNAPHVAPLSAGERP